ncbi:putative transcription factor C2H2 family [Helianthus annuus]|nr:putative transcription factor C2H2 family [Helianthus annuus]
MSSVFVSWVCNHAFHFHCISRWLKTRQVCPLGMQALSPHMQDLRYRRHSQGLWFGCVYR